ncbi:hypothetical protein CHUAL_001827 [Chamberlinius hualienensis]
MEKIGTLCFLLLCAYVGAVSYDKLSLEEFRLFKTEHGKTYRDETEETFRMKIFHENRLMINDHNRLYREGKVTFEMGMNKFGDMLTHEVAEMMMGSKMSAKTIVRTGSTYMKSSNVVVPKEMDWRQSGYVTPVKNQGACGSCWAFSTIGSLEGQHYRKTGKLVSLSEQNLVDCSKQYGNRGCEGGQMNPAFNYIKDNKGVDTEDSYPYEAKNGVCRFNSTNVGATCTGHYDVQGDNERVLMDAVGTVGPVSVAIDAAHRSFVFYKHGVHYQPGCNDDVVNHGLVIVGYGYDKKLNVNYWIVKNSWGDKWGEQGYIRMIKDYLSNCGIASMPSYPMV